MERDYSPFTPGTPVSVELFSGREDQIRELELMVKRAAAGQITVGFMSGERGIGKSSLARYVNILSERNHEMLGLHVFLGGVTELEEMARRIFERLLKDSIDRPWHDKVKKFLGNHVRKVGLFGVTVEFTAGPRELKQAVNDFASALRNLINELKDQKKGLFLILDDINGLASSPDFANWLKSLVDEIATSRDPIPLCLLLVGLEERRRELINSQESLARVFTLVDLPVWSDKESKNFFEKAFGSIKVKVKKKALGIMVFISQGFPMIAHEVGHAVLRIDQDNVIDSDDALTGTNRAAEVIGRKYLEPKVLEAIQSRKYRNILNKIFINIKTPSPIFSRADLAEFLSSDERKVLDNFLRKMKKLGVIAPYPERGKGVYCFRTHIHSLYFMMISTPPEKNPRPKHNRNAS